VQEEAEEEQESLKALLSAAVAKLSLVSTIFLCHLVTLSLFAPALLMPLSLIENSPLAKLISIVLSVHKKKHVFTFIVCCIL